MKLYSNRLTGYNLSFFRTYPTRYRGIAGIASYTQFLVTDSAGNVKCVSSSAYITREFLLGQYASLDQLISTIKKPECKLYLVSPAMVLVPVLSLTQTETNFEGSPARQTSAAGKAAPSKPIIAPTVTPTSLLEANPQETFPTLSKSLIVEPRPNKPNIPPQTTLNVERSSSSIPEFPSSDRGPAADKDLPPVSSATSPDLQPSRVNGQNAEGSKDTSIFDSDNISPESNTLNSPENIVTSIPPNGGNEEPTQVFLTSSLTFVGQVEARPTPAPQLAVSVGSSIISADLDGNFVIADQTLVPGGSPVTALGKSIYLQPSNAAVVVDGSTISLQQALPQPSYPRPPMILPIGSNRIAADTEGNFVIGSQTLVPGGSPVTALGKSIYLQPSNAAAVIDGNTVTLEQAP